MIFANIKKQEKSLYSISAIESLANIDFFWQTEFAVQNLDNNRLNLPYLEVFLTN